MAAPLTPHVEHKEEQRVQHNVERRAEQRGAHAHAREPLRVDEEIQARAHHGKGGAEQVIREVFARIRVGVVARAEEVQKRAHERIAQRHNPNGRTKQQPRARAEDLAGAFFVALPARNGKQRRTTHAKEVRKRRDQRDDRERDAHAGERQPVGIGQVADVDAVHHVISTWMSCAMVSGRPARGYSSPSRLLKNHVPTGIPPSPRRFCGNPLRRQRGLFRFDEQKVKKLRFGFIIPPPGGRVKRGAAHSADYYKFVT